MKNLFLAVALLISSIVFSQEPVLDSIQVFKPMPNPELIATMYEYETFFDKLTIVSDETGVNSVICVFFYKENEDAPQKTMVKNFTRKQK